MVNENSEFSGDEKRISRRKLLFGAIAAAFAGTVAYIEAITGLPSLIIGEKLPLWVESSKQYKDDEISFTEQLLLNEQNFEVKRLQVSAQRKTVDPLAANAANVILVEYKNSATISLEPTNSGRRDLSILDKTGVSGPVAPVTGDFVHNQSDVVVDRDVNMSMPARDKNGADYGGTELIDRMLPLGPEVNNNASGGLVFKDETFHIVDKETLNNAKNTGQSFMQAWYTISNQNEETLLQQNWTHQKVQAEIGDSVYSWSAYIEYHDNSGTVRKGLIVLEKTEDRLAIWHLVKLCKQLSANGQYKLALTDAGNGNPVFIRPPSQSQHY